MVSGHLVSEVLHEELWKIFTAISLKLVQNWIQNKTKQKSNMFGALESMKTAGEFYSLVRKGN